MRTTHIIAFAAALALPAFGAEWKQLWNGKDLTGWAHIGYGRFVVDDGILKTEGVDRTLGLLWYTAGPVGDCTLRVVFREVGKGNSGVYIRIPEKPSDEQKVVRIAHEIQIGGASTGEIYGVTRVLAPPPLKTDDWNTMEITMEGQHTIVTVNGVKVTDYTPGVTPVREKMAEYYKTPRPDKGWFGIQNHNLDVVWFKEIAIKPLK